MAELLLELFSEEIPARMQLPMVEKLKNELQTRLKKEKLYFQKIQGYATPRRLVISIDGMSLTQEDTKEERRGPKVSAPEQAVNGFLKSTGLSLEHLEQRETDKGTFYFASIEQRGRPTKDILKDALEDILPNLTWPKSMRWGDHKTRWVRPLKNILCAFGGETLPITFGHLTANDNSLGHRFLHTESFKATSLSELESGLAKRNVVLCTEKRKSIILEKSLELAESAGLELIEDDALLTEVAGLVEHQEPLLGSIDSQFMVVPEECLISSIRLHQKYFCLRNKDGSMAAKFIVVSNMKSTDGGASITAGNERVLRARLADAKFFWDQDHKVSLDERAKGLERMVFHAKLGTVAEKSQRISALAKFIAVWVPHADLDLVARAADLCKADLTTEMVGEFADLQGVMGRYYAEHGGEDQAVSDAICQHYAPLGQSASVPTNPVSVAVALADKIDTLCGLFAANEKPTGSKDPFALRRAALGVIRIILENKLPMQMRTVFEHALKSYPKSLFKHCEDIDKKGILGGQKQFCTTTKPSSIVDDLMVFFEERLKALLKGENVRHDLISAVLADGAEDDLLRVVQRVAALDQLLATDDGVNLLAAYKRATNIVRIEEKKDEYQYDGKPSSHLLEQAEEKTLFKSINDIKPIIKDALKDNRFSDAMTSVSTLRGPIDAFFDHVTVNDDNKDLRKNRLKLLSSMSKLLDAVADFSHIEG